MANLASRTIVPASANNSKKDEDKVPSKIWMNVGVILADGSFERFERLGTAIDTAPQRKGGKGESEFAAKMAAVNQTISGLRDHALANIQPGQSIILARDPQPGDIVVELRHAEMKEEVVAEENPYAVNFLALLNVKAA